MPARAFLTPDTPTAGDYVSRRLRVPRTYLHAVSGAIAQLSHEHIWEAFGTESPADAAQRMLDLWIQFVEQSGVGMIGMVATFAGSPPAGWLVCDGSLYDRDDYPALYDALDVQYRTSETQFVVPDLRDRVVITAGNLYTLGSAGGSAAVSLTVDQLPAHTHSSHVHGPDVDVEQPAGVPTPAPGVGAPGITGSTGAGAAHENLPPYLALTAAILAE